MKKTILILTLCCFFYCGKGQDNSATIGGANSPTDQTAFNFEYDITPNIGDFVALQHSSLSWQPDIKIQIGGKDVLDGIVAKYSGLLSKYKFTDDPDIPDLSKTIQVFSFSGGFEANQSFNVINGLMEFGYMPWYQNQTKSSIIRKTKFGAFAQLGYKFQGENVHLGGNQDQSQENEDDVLARLKTSFVYAPEIKLGTNAKIITEGAAHAWLDIVNSDIYYNIKGSLKLEVKKYTWIVKYEKGSGAPNFNEGDQFGGGLQIAF